MPSKTFFFFFFFFLFGILEGNVRLAGTTLYAVSNICGGSLTEQLLWCCFLFTHSFTHRNCCAATAGQSWHKQGKSRSLWSRILQDRWITTNGPGLVPLSSYYLNQPGSKNVLKFSLYLTGHRLPWATSREAAKHIHAASLSQKRNPSGDTATFKMQRLGYVHYCSNLPMGRGLLKDGFQRRKRFEWRQMMSEAEFELQPKLLAC